MFPSLSDFNDTEVDVTKEIKDSEESGVLRLISPLNKILVDFKLPNF